ncbi:MAG: hypothetical protein COA78_06345 [Blastopirellula sp.]|nr:MAG: hypothetical protein COA78_06345 [Blastopirellula sp.]
MGAIRVRGKHDDQSVPSFAIDLAFVKSTIASCKGRGFALNYIFKSVMEVNVPQVGASREMNRYCAN